MGALYELRSAFLLYVPIEKLISWCLIFDKYPGPVKGSLYSCTVYPPKDFTTAVRCTFQHYSYPQHAFGPTSYMYF